jgi:hypothetical protein
LKKPLQISKYDQCCASCSISAIVPRQDPRGRFRDPRFASFMLESNRRPHGTDRYDALLKGRKLVNTVLRLGVGIGTAWIVLESAQALSVF